MNKNRHFIANITQPLQLGKAVLLGLLFLLGACTYSGNADNSSVNSPAKLEITTPTPEVLELTAGDRTSKVWVWEAQGDTKASILFSHGALSAPWKYENLIAYWIAEGYKVYAPLHVDSTDHPNTADFPGLASWQARLEDMQALRNHITDESYIAAGHSYGALVALNLGGAKQALPKEFENTTYDPRVSVVLAFSPPGEMPGFVTQNGYSSIAVPSLVQTGLLDAPPGGTWDTHLAAYNAAPVNSNHYAIVFEKVDHYFGGAICRPELPGPAQSQELSSAAALSIHMIQAFHEKNTKALEKLNAQITDTPNTETTLGLRTK